MFRAITIGDINNDTLFDEFFQEKSYPLCDLNEVRLNKLFTDTISSVEKLNNLLEKEEYKKSVETFITFYKGITKSN